MEDKTHTHTHTHIKTVRDDDEMRSTAPPSLTHKCTPRRPCYVRMSHRRHLPCARLQYAACRSHVSMIVGLSLARDCDRQRFPRIGVRWLAPPLRANTIGISPLRWDTIGSLRLCCAVEVTGC